MKIFLLFLAIASVIASYYIGKYGISRNSPILIVASGENGNPRLNFHGDFRLKYKTNVSTFEYEIIAHEKPVVVGTGAFKWLEEGKIQISIKYSASVPFDIRFLGFSCENKNLYESIDCINIKRGEGESLFVFYCQQWYEFD